MNYEYFTGDCNYNMFFVLYFLRYVDVMRNHLCTQKKKKNTSFPKTYLQTKMKYLRTKNTCCFRNISISTMHQMFSIFDSSSVLAVDFQWAWFVFSIFHYLQRISKKRLCACDSRTELVQYAYAPSTPDVVLPRLKTYTFNKIDYIWYVGNKTVNLFTSMTCARSTRYTGIWEFQSQTIVDIKWQ